MSNAWMVEKISGYAESELFGYSHMYGRAFDVALRRRHDNSTST
jgi:hypothetical protein